VGLLKDVSRAPDPHGPIWRPAPAPAPAVAPAAGAGAGVGAMDVDTARPARPPSRPHDLVTTFQCAQAVMDCLELLLMRKDTVTALLDLGVFLVVTDVLKLGFGNPRMFMTSVVCAVDASTHTVGHSPLVHAVARCVGLFASSEPEKTLEVGVRALLLSFTRVTSNIMSPTDPCRSPRPAVIIVWLPGGAGGDGRDPEGAGRGRRGLLARPRR